MFAPGNVSYKFKQLLLYKVRVAVEFAAVFQASGPGEDAGNGVGTGLSSLQGTDTVKVTNCNFKVTVWHSDLFS